MSNGKYIKEIILERNPKAIFLEEIFDKAILGSSIPCGQKHVATYDSNKCIEILIDMLEGEEEAYEQYDNTINNSPSSENSPIFFSDFSNIVIPKFPTLTEDMTLDKLI